jgi:hypothetical protein
MFPRSGDDEYASGSLPRKTDFGFFLLSFDLLVISEKYELRPNTQSLDHGSNHPLDRKGDLSLGKACFFIGDASSPLYIVFQFLRMLPSLC